VVGRWTRNRKITSSTPGRGAIKSTRSTQPSIHPGQVNRVPACMAGVRWSVFACVGWQVTLCGPIRQVKSRSSEVGFPQEELYRPLPLLLEELAACFLTLDSSARGSGLGRPRVSWRVILYESTVRATFNTPCELLGELPGYCCANVWWNSGWKTLP